ncbi:MAG TPA: alpha/beta fold hydrolase [Planktothrix sp.]
MSKFLIIAMAASLFVGTSAQAAWSAPVQSKVTMSQEKADSLREMAEELWQKEEFKSAKSAYETLLSDADCGKDSGWLEMRLGNCLTRLTKYSQADPLFKKALARAESDRDVELQIACLVGLSACQYYRDNYSEAEKYARRALQICPAKPKGDYSQAQMELFVGETLYKQLRYDQAISFYEQSIQHCKDDVRTERDALSGAIASYERMKRHDKATKYCEQLAAIDRKLYGDQSLDYAWTLERLSLCYNAVGNAKGEPLYEKAIWIYRKSNADRLLKEFGLDDSAPMPTSQDEFLRRKDRKARILRLVYGGGYRGFSDEDAFLEAIPLSTSLDRISSGAWTTERRKVEAPGYVWLDPGVEPKAVLICVHGLGLEHKSFDSFARRIAPEGFITVAFDVRGFGSYLTDKGRERLDMDGCIDDLKTVAKVLRRDNPNLPLFVLGESMGGAIALRLTAEAPDLIDGLVCSVPSGSRYKSRRTALNVALRYIGNKNKPFNVGAGVVKQATNQKSVRDEWTNDPMGRLKLSPSELVQFQRFMDANAKYAKRIKVTPVMIFQGDDDKLVKEKGTYDLFEALPSQDKAMVIVGSTEHLIFEAGQFRDGLAMGVVGWLESHVPVCQIAPGQTTAVRPVDATAAR